MSVEHAGGTSFAELTISDPDLRLDPEVEWSGHAKDRWNERAGDVGYLRAWAQSEEVDYPSAHSKARGRYHEATDTVLIVKRVRRNGGSVGWQFVDIVMSVIELTDREPDEQRYVRQQVRGDR